MVWAVRQVLPPQMKLPTGNAWSNCQKAAPLLSVLNPFSKLRIQMKTTPPTPPTPLGLGEKIKVILWRMIMGMLSLLAGKRMPKGRTRTHRYGTLRDEELDAISPAPTADARAVVVHIHGGGWITGSKGRFYTKPLLNLAEAGHPVFSINYPLAPEHPHPQALHSCLQALAWIKRTYPAHQRVHLIGDSAGGNLAMMLGILLANPNMLQGLDGIDPATLPTVISISSLYGVLDRTTWIADGFPGAGIFLKSYAGPGADAPDFKASVPVTPMDMPDFAHLPPTFIVGASQDKLLRSSETYSAHLRQRFQQVTYKVYPGAAHGFFNFGKQSDALGIDLLGFLRQQA
jgi:acetyl esterase/lipase